MEIELLTVNVLGSDGTSYSPMVVDGESIVLVEYGYVSSRMGTTSLTSTLKHAVCLDDYWTGREFVDFRGVRLYLDHRPGSSKDNTDARYVHTLEFRAGRDILLSGVYFCDAVAAGAASAGKPQSNSYDVKFFGTLDEFVQRFNDVLSYRGLSSRFSVSLEAGVVGTTESLEMEFSNVTLFEALQKAVEVWEVPFYFSGDSAVFGSADSQALVGVEYGGDRELLSVSMNPRGEKIVTRISGSGGSDNVPYYYPNPSPKGTLGVGGTATGVTVADQYRFGQLVGLSDVLTYTGRAASFGGVTLTFGGQTGQSAAGGVTAVVEDVSVVSGVSYPFRVTVSADLSGGFDRELRVPLYANVGNTEQIPGSTTLYYVKSAWGGQGTEYVPKEGSEVAAKGWEMVVDRVEVSFGSVTKQVDFECDYSQVEMTEADRALYPERKLTGVVLDFAEVLSSFPSGVSLSQCSVAIVGHLCSHVRWQVGTGSGSPAGFFCETMSATGAFDPCGWYLGDGSIGDDLSVVGLSQSGSPVEGSTITQVVLSYVTPTGKLMPSVYRTSGGATRFYDAENDTYVDPETGDYYEFENEYDPLEPHEHVEDFEEVVPSIKNLQDGSGNPLNVLQDVYFDEGYNTRDVLADGETLKYQWFFVKLKPLGFNLFDCAIEDGDMALVMGDGPCAGCHFKILVTTAGKNPVQKNNNGTLKKEGGYGVIDPDNIQASQQDTTSNAVWVALYLDDSTFGGTEVEYGVMPAYDKASDAGPKPVSGNAYTLENILLPQAFFTAAEAELDRRLIAFMAEHNADKYDPSVTFSRIWLAHNPTVRAALSERSRLSLTYDGKVYSPLYVSQFTLNVKEGDALPEILVETSDIVEARSSGLDDRIDAAVDSALNVVKGQTGGVDLTETDRRYLRKDAEDVAGEKIVFAKGLEVGEYKPGFGGIGGTIYTNSAGEAIAEVDFLNVRRKATFTQVEIDQLRKVNGTILLSLAEMKCSAVEAVSGGWRCFFKTDAEDGSALENGFEVGDLAICQTYRNNNTHYYWRKVIGAGADYIILSDANGEYAENSDAPEPGDTIVQLGNVSDSSRQSAQILDCYGADSPSYVVYAGINSFSLANKDIFGERYVYNSTSGAYEPYFFNYGPMLLGSRDQTQEYVAFRDGVLDIKGRLTVRKSDGSYEAMSTYIADQKTLTDSLQAQIDGQIESFEGASAPLPQLVNGTVDYSTANSPASGWTTDATRAKHVGDIFTDNSTGHLYRYTRQPASPQRYYWTLVQDEEIAEVVTGLSQLQYLKVATNGGTLVDGGLVLTSLIQLGMPGTGGAYNVWSGINGVINDQLTDPMQSIAAWFGGPMVDHEKTPSAQSYAKSLLRMDGTGYLAGGNITWNADGSGSVAGGNLSWDSNGVPTIAGGVEIGTSGSTLADLLAAMYFEQNTTLTSLVQLKSAYSYLGAKSGIFFSGATLTGTPTPDLYVDTVNGQRVLRTPLPLITGGDQIVIDGTPGGGGSGGGGFLYELGDIYHKNAQSQDVQYVAHADGSRPDAGDVLTYNATKGWLAAPSSGGSGTVTSIVVGDTPYSPVSGVVTLPAYPTTLPASDVYSWAKASTKPSYNFSEIGNTPTTLSGYSITDGVNDVETTGSGNAVTTASISGHKLTLTKGTTFLTSHQTIYTLTFAAGTFTAGTYTPNSAAKTINVPTTLDHITDGTNRKLSDYKTIASLKTKGSASMPVYFDSSGDAQEITSLDLLSKNTGYVKANRYYITSTVYFEWVDNSGNGYVKLNAPFLTEGDQIVNSGTPGGGGTGGAGYLYELGDVTIPHGTTHPNNGEALIYRNGYWVNEALPAGTTYTEGTGITISPSNQISVTANTYAPYNSAGYLPLSAGSTKALTGALYISSGSVYDLYINNTSTNADTVGIRFQVGGTTIGELYTRTSDNQLVWNGGSNGAKVIYHTGNLTLSNGAITIGSNTITPVTAVAVGTGNNADKLGITAGSSTSYITVPYATHANYLDVTPVTADAQLVTSGVRAYQGPGQTSWDGVSTMNYAGIFSLGTYSRGWQMWAARGDTGLYWRNGLNDMTGWADPRLIYDSYTLTKSVITGLLGNEYHPYGGGETIALSASNLTAYSGLTAYNAAKTYRLNFNFPTTGNDLTVGRIYNVTEDGQTAVGDLNIQSGLIYCVGASRVGINTPNPSSSYRLDVNGNVGVTGSLTIGGATISWVASGNSGYLKINAALLTEGDQIVNSGTPGGGGGGTIPYLYELQDVTITNIGTGNLLQWNGSAWVNVAASSVGVTTVATTQALGLVKSTTTGTTANRTYNVEVNTDGTMKVNVPWENNTYSLLTSSANGLAPAFSTANKATSASTNSYHFLGWTGSTMKWYTLPANAFSDTTYSAATQSAAGLMSSTDKTKLDGIATGATAVTDTTVSGWGYLKTDENVKQTATTTNATYEVLFSYSANNTTTTEGARKTSTLTYNPSTKALSTGGAVNGLTLTAATTGFTIAGGSTTSKTLTVNETGTAVLLTATQALTNKTYNGYTLGDACAKGYTDSSSASAISTGTSLVTERDVYYGLPTINNAHNYTSSTTIYAPTGSGTSGYWLKASGGTSAPTWEATSNLEAGKVTTTADTTNALYVVGVTSSATSTLKRDTSVTITGGAVSATSFSASNSSGACLGLTITSATGNWSYIRLINKDTATNYWDIATHNSTSTAIAQANAFEIRNGRDSNSGISIRNNTSSYGKLVVRVPSGQCSIGYWSTDDNPVSGSPIWTSGYTADTDKTFGWYYRGSSDSGWKMSVSPSGDLTHTGVFNTSKINLRRSSGVTYGRISYYSPAYYTWFTYMSNAASGASPTGATPPTGTYVTGWALRSLLENTAGQGWTWESCANGANNVPAIKMELSSATGNLKVYGSLDIGSSSSAALNFQRGSANYINAPASGYFVFMANGATGGVANASLIIEESNVYARKSVSLGTSTYRWSNVYSSGLNVAYGSSGWASSIESTNAKIFITHSGGTAMAVGSKYATSATDNVIYVRSGQTTLGSGGTYILQLAANGTLTTYGDQVVSSDASLKKDWRPLNYGISDIAKTTAGVFTWKDGRGISAGTKAQDWEKLVPQLVHGDEGHKTLAYGQVAMLNTILLARGYESHEERIKRLEARVAELELENEQLRAN